MSALGEVMAAVADDVIAAKDALNRLDAKAGDGDMGVTMSTAAAALKNVLPELDSQELPSVLKRCGSEVARKAPSTSGTLLATALLRAGRAAERSNGSPAAQLAELVEAAQQGVQERGKAVPGDKTLLDALAPAVAALHEAAVKGASISEALQQAATAAAAGADATRSMRPRVGRASWMADRSEGNVDAGAHLVALLFQSATRHAAARAEPRAP